MTLITASRAERGIVIFFVCLYLFKAKEINIFEEGESFQVILFYFCPSLRGRIMCGGLDYFSVKLEYEAE